MNIVQQQHDLEMMGVPELQKLAQGTNPNVPAYLALAVLNQKMASREKAGLASGAAQGQQRSVAEQVDQKAGLMALDQQKQQQAQQMMAQQAQQTPQAVPEGIPTPQPQAQATMMASGGIARLPIDPRMTEYAEGGVVAFAAGDIVPPKPKNPDFDEDGNPRTQEERAAVIAENKALAAGLARTAGLRSPSTASPLQEKRMQDFYKPRMTPGGEQRPDVTPVDVPPVAVPPVDVPPAAPAVAAAKPPAMGGAGAVPVAGKTPMTGPGLPSALPAAPPAQTGMMAQLAKEVATPGTAPTPEGIMAERAKMMPEELKTPADAGLKQRTAAMEEQYQGSKKDRDFERMLAVLGGGARGGMGGFAPAYLGAVQGERTADTAHAAEMNRLLSGGENVRRGEAASEYAGRTAGLTAAKTAFSDTERNRITALASGASSQQQGEEASANISQRQAESLLNNLTNVQVARIQAASANRPGETERITAEYISRYAKDPKDAERFMELIERAKGAGKGIGVSERNDIAGLKAVRTGLTDDLKDMRLKGPDRAAKQAQIAEIDKQILKLSGSPTIAAAPGAKSPGGNTRMQFNAKGEPI